MLHRFFIFFIVFSFSFNVMALTPCESLIEEATMQARIDVTKNLISKFQIDLNECRDNQLMNVLHRAASAAHVSLVEYLLTQKISIEEKTAWGASALNIAADSAYLGAIKIVKLLLANGADVETRDNRGATPLISVLYMNGTAYSERYKSDHFQIVKTLIEDYGANVNAQEFKINQYGNTGLIYAARHTGNSYAVKYLLDHGAEVNLVNSAGRTAIMEAIESRDSTSLDFILEKSSPNIINFQDNKKISALMIAARQGDSSINMVESLLGKGAIKSLKNTEGETALDVAMKFKAQGSKIHNQVIQFLSVK